MRRLEKKEVQGMKAADEGEQAAGDTLRTGPSYTSRNCGDVPQSGTRTHRFRHGHKSPAFSARAG
jgi:hypothetical protein